MSDLLASESHSVMAKKKALFKPKKKMTKHYYFFQHQRHDIGYCLLTFYCLEIPFPFHLLKDGINDKTLLSVSNCSLNIHIFFK